MAKDLRPVYTAANEAAALTRVQEFDDQWGQQYPAITRMWRSSWTEFVPFLDYDVEVRRVISRHQRHREPQRPLPASNPRPRPPPDRAGRPEMPLFGHPITEPHRPGKSTMGHTLEASIERVCSQLRRPNRSDHYKLMTNISYTEVPSVILKGSGGFAPPYLLPSLATVSSAGRRTSRTGRRGLRGA